MELTRTDFSAIVKVLKYLDEQAYEGLRFDGTISFSAEEIEIRVESRDDEKGHYVKEIKYL